VDFEKRILEVDSNNDLTTCLALSQLKSLGCKIGLISDCVAEALLMAYKNVLITVFWCIILWLFKRILILHILTHNITGRNYTDKLMITFFLQPPVSARCFLSHQVQA